MGTSRLYIGSRRGGLHLTENQIEKFAGSVLNWFSENSRTFPWRNTSNPYYVLIAEVLLLRQTQATGVVGPYIEVEKILPSSVSSEVL